MPYDLLTKVGQSTGPENVGPERTLQDPFWQGQDNSPTRITPEYNGKIQPQPDQEKAFAMASGGGNATTVEPSLAKSQ